MGRYSIRQVLTQEPAAIVAVLHAWAALAIVAGWMTLSAEVLAAGEAAVLATLLIGYVRPLTNSKAAMRELAEGLEEQAPPPRARKAAERPI